MAKELPERFRRQHEGKNVCQYWVNEPVQCSFWDEAEQTCTNEDIPTPSSFPNCNKIGTDIGCNKYDGDGTKEFRCILPDISRQVGRRFKAKEGDSIKWLRDQITEYNEGECDEHGTAARCSAYYPFQMGFTSVQPDTDPFEATSDSTTVDGLSFRLPFSYDVSYLRAQLGRCYWWKADASIFTMDEAGKIGDLTNKCANTYDSNIEKYWTDHEYDEELGMYTAPCNGAKPECARYTGICWEYCIDEKMKQGDKVLAEQIQELRYYVKKDRWTVEKFKDAFEEPEIQAWEGLLYQNLEPKINTVAWLIEARNVGLNSFDTFDLYKTHVILTAGTPANDYVGDYPTKIRDLKGIHLAPVIRNKFDVVENTTINFFETTNFDDDTVLIFGDMFWYDSQTYGVNLSDPELSFLPINTLMQYETMFDIEISFNDDVLFSEFYEELAYKLEYLKAVSPDKFVLASAGSDTNCFFIDVPTFEGENNIFVFNEGGGTWEYDDITVSRFFCGGVLAQTSFDIQGYGGVPYLPDYSTNFLAFVNKYGFLNFQFYPLSSSEASYGTVSIDHLYDDGVQKRLESNLIIPSEFDTYDMMYQLFKVTFASKLELPVAQLRVLGNAGYILVDIPDVRNVLSNVVKPWEIEGNMYLKYVDDNGEISHKCSMEIFKKDELGIEVNQIIIKPKNINDFRPVCENTSLFIPKIYVYEKKSYGEESEGEEIDESFLTTSGTYPDEVAYQSYFSVAEYDDGVYELRGFNSHSFTPTVVFKGITGRIRGQVKTKLTTWVRQPFCRDVEIHYGWGAYYTEYTLLPSHNCWFSDGAGPSATYKIDKVYRAFTPQCGDHSLSSFNYTGPMWYPYNECNSTARYNITGNLSEWAINTMEVFQPDEFGDIEHGSWDMRMLGPSEHYGFTCDTHAQIPNCTCDWSFCNHDKVTSNIFGGSASYRGGVQGEAAYWMTKNGGSLPKFGNVFRDYLRSYRSMDNVDYYKLNTTTLSFNRRKKWVPIYEFYSFADISRGASADDWPWMVYTSDDFYDNSHTAFQHPMGFLMATRSIEGVNIGEEILTEEDSDPESGIEVSVRLRFDEVFRPHSSTAGLFYPYPRSPKQSGGLISQDIIPWFTYKDPPGSTGKSIHWAWQEVWLPLEREAIDLNVSREYDVQDDHKILTGEIFIEKLQRPYVEDLGGSVAGKHLFLDINYPEYKYDVELMEYRLVCDEGSRVIEITAPEEIEDAPGSYDSNLAAWTTTIDNGKGRCFDASGNWLAVPTDGSCNVALYTACSTEDWYYEDVTVFSESDASATPHSDRTVLESYDDFTGDPIEKYYNYGLNIIVNSAFMDYLPYKIVLTDFEGEDGHQMRFSRPQDTAINTENPWSGVESNEWYPANFGFDVYYSVDDGAGDDYSLNIDYELLNKRTILGVIIEFDYGPAEDEGIDKTIPGYVFVGTLYHLPGIRMFTSEDGASFTQVYELDSMSLATKDDDRDDENRLRCFYDIDFSPSDVLSTNHRYFRISFRLKPTAEEIAEKTGLSTYFNNAGVNNVCNISSIRLYYCEFVDAEEDIVVYERKYKISVGDHGDFAPHGSDSGGSLLYPLNSDKSSVYQHDMAGGVIGGGASTAGASKSMNKLRGRIMKQIEEDNTPIPGNDVIDFEAKQKKIHDEIIDSGSTTFTLESTAPPGLEDQLSAPFPSWNCTFRNTYVRPLSRIIPLFSYSPCGHSFDWDIEHIRSDWPCGWTNLRVNRFDYIFRQVCGTHSTGTVDALQAYADVVGRTLVDPMAFIAPTYKGYDATSPSNKTYEDDQEILFPVAIDSFLY